MFCHMKQYTNSVHTPSRKCDIWEQPILFCNIKKYFHVKVMKQKRILACILLNIQIYCIFLEFIVNVKYKN